jgi:ElaB/YqjD/DUF883 family membrane-anchored ribosome-binding protein
VIRLPQLGVYCYAAIKENTMNSDFSSATPESGSTTRSGAGSTQGSYERAQEGASLREELANLKSDLDALMSHASTLTDRELREARDKIMAKFSSMRYAAKGMATEASKQLNRGVDVTSEYVKDRPLQSVAIATGVGLLLGAALRRH